MMLIDQSIAAFLRELKSDSPAPGGGSAAALAGAVGAALAIMVGRLTLGSANYEPVHAECGQIAAALEPCLAKLTAYIDEDTAAFNKVMAAYKLPKTTDAEKTARGSAIQAALKQASNLPLAVAQTCLDVLELAGKMLVIGNANAASDAAVAGRLAQAAMWSAVYNVRINLSSIKDAAFVADMTARTEHTIIRSKALLDQLITTANEKI